MARLRERQEEIKIIEDAKTLEEIVAKLNPLSLVETEREVKGEAFEYFLQRYNAGEKDLGEYFN